MPPRHVIGLSALLLALAGGAAAQEPPPQAFDKEGPVEEVPVSDHPIRALPVLRFRSSDPRLNTAWREARAVLPNVIAATEKARGHFSPSLALLIAVKLPGGAPPLEFLWVDTIRREGDFYHGRLASQPRHLPERQRGDEITFLYPQIYDWAVQAVDGRFYGYFTTRVLIEDMEDPLRSEIGARLLPRPVPGLWR